MVKVVERNVLSDSNPALRLPLGFAGGLADADTGLVRFGVRDYDPDVGRFTAPDPLGPAGGEDDPYGYCMDDPVNLVDPSGMWFSTPWPGVNIAGSGVIGAIGGALKGLPFGLPGVIGGAMAGGTAGLLGGTVNEAMEKWLEEQDELQKKEEQVEKEYYPD